MNAQQIATSTAPSPHLLDAINAGLSPYMLGALDAGCGRERTPGEYYIWAGDIAEYNEGYADEAQDAAHMQDTREYEQDILDRQYHSRGGW